MQFVIDQLKLLGLNEREIKIFTTLVAFGQMGMSNIARKANLPRTTVDAAVKRLVEQGLIEVFHVKRHKEYAVDLTKVTKKLTELNLNLDPKHALASSEVTRETSHDAIEILVGLPALYAVYEELSDVAKTERIYVVEGREAARRELASSPRELLFELHRRQKSNELIIEGILSESALAIVDELDVETLESHYGRLTIVYLVPAGYLLSDMNIFISRRFVALYSFESESGVKLHDKNIIRGFYDLYQLAAQQGRKIDFNAYLRDAIEKKKRSGKEY